MTYETILFDVNDGVAMITLNRPESLNAFNDLMIQETMDAFRQCGRDAKVRSIVLTGNGRGFSAGQDLKDFQARGPNVAVGEHLRHGYNRLIERMITLEKPIVGAINGVAAGAGCSVALATDLRIASDGASFIQAFSRVGLIPDSGSTWMLPRLIGYPRAFQMAITAEKVDAARALAWGLVNDVVPAAQLPEIVAAWARKLADGPTLAFGLTKRAMWGSWGRSLTESLTYESQLQDIAARSRDAAEGILAFVEKRPADYRGE